MTTRRYLQLDVFAERPGTGNPLAVVLDAEGLDDATMQAIARWMRLPETTFVFPPTAPGASYRVRIFSPAREVPFAGHPSVGTAFAVFDAGLARPVDGQLVQEGVAGLLPLSVEGDDGQEVVAVRTPEAAVVEVATHDDPRLADAIAPLGPGRLPPALVEGGRRWWLVEAADETTLRAAQPDWAAIASLADASGSMGICAFACAAAGAGHDLAVRAFVGAGEPFEDAASGAANAILAAWLARNDALPGRDGRYVASQGREVGADARIRLRVDADGRVWSGGRVQTVVRGTLDW